MRSIRLVFAAFVLAWLPLAASAAEIVFLSGTKLEGTVISKDDKTMKVEVVVNGKPVARSYPLSSVHTVTINGKLYVINEKRADTSAASGSAATDPRGAGTRTKAEVQKLIDTEGREPPEWFEATTVNTPASLDMSWPEPVPGGWNNQKNMGQYIWDIINPNPNKWREGVKLMHTLLITHPVSYTHLTLPTTERV